jgi:DNA-binding NarL/FixJ family response regulator
VNALPDITAAPVRTDAPSSAPTARQLRLIVIGTSAERRDFRARLEGSGFDVIAEFPSIADARAAGVAADAMLVVPQHPSRAHDDGPRLESLTPREIEVLEGVAQGLPNKAIADRLGISDQTVKFHVASISGKLGAANRTDAVRRGVRRGLITL